MAATEAHHSAKRTSKGSSRQRSQQDLLLELLSIGRLVMTRQWNFTARDWVTCVYVEDIDGDSDIEVVMGSRDGYVRVLTRRGTLRCEYSPGKREWITALAHVPVASGPASDIASNTLPLPSNTPLPHIIVGTRGGYVRALTITQQGKMRLEEKWQFPLKESEGVRALAIHPKYPDEVLVGGDDRYVYMLDSTTGACRWQHQFEGRVHSICVADVDGDGEEEIVVSSTDKHIHILTRAGDPKGSIPLNYKSYVLAVDVPQAREGQEPAGPPTIFACYRGKGLRGWTIPPQSSNTTLAEQLATLQPTWPQPQEVPNLPRGRAQPKLERDEIKSRPLAIHLADINNDGYAELLVGCADHSLAILDHTGQLLWRHNFGSAIYSVYARDYDNDGMYEIFVGLGNHALRVMRVDLNPAHKLGIESDKALYSQIQTITTKMRSQGREPEIKDEALNELASELGLLQPEQRIVHRELYEAVLKQQHEKYKEAIAMFQRLLEQRVHYYWQQPLTNLGHIRAITVGDIHDNALDEVMVGNNEGEVTAFDIKNAIGDDRSHKMQEVWEERAVLGASVVALQSGRQNKEEFAVTLVVLADRTVRLLSPEGKELPLPIALSQEQKRITSLALTYESQQDAIIDTTLIKDVLLGLENGNIYIYDKYLQQRRATIETPRRIEALCACDMTQSGRLDIVVGNADHAVRLYAQDEHDPTRFHERWSYQTHDRIRALKAVDLNNDGCIEVVVGSEDRNLYVLNQNGQLEWRYLMPDTVLCLDACDIDGDGRLEIITGAPDGKISFFNCDGDPLRDVQVGDRVNALLVKDLHPGELTDGLVEIVVGTDDSLLIYQALDRKEIEARISDCWRRLRKHPQDRQLLYLYADRLMEKDEYLRAFALRRLAGTFQHQEKDFEVLKDAVTSDSSQVVAKALAVAVVNIHKSSMKNAEWRKRAQQLLDLLAQKPQRETKVAIVDMLDVLAQDDPRLSLFYLEKFLGNEDFRLRRMVVRQLYNLTDITWFIDETRENDGSGYEHARKFLSRIFSLLITATHDQHLWVRQESGRSLAHYFDMNPDRLFLDLHTLVGDGVDTAVVEQIAICAKKPDVKRFFSAYTTFLKDVRYICSEEELEEQPEDLQQNEKDNLFRAQKKRYKTALETFLQELQHHNNAEDLQAVYKDLNHLLEINTLEAIEQFYTFSNEADWSTFDHFTYIGKLLKEIDTVIAEIKHAGRRDAFTDRASALMDVMYHLSQIRHRYIDSRNRALPDEYADSTSLLAVEDILLRVALHQWSMLLRNTLHQLRGKAKPVVTLLPENIQRGREIELFFKLVNEGSSVADDISVSIQPGPDYDIIQQAVCSPEELSPTRVVHFSCRLSTQLSVFSVVTRVKYTDAEGQAESTLYHHVERKPSQTPFQEIPNPYHGGTPIGSKENMLYGRSEDIRFLYGILSNTESSANHIVLLLGQRRSGKTSMLNRLVWDMKQQVPVLLDMQALAMSKSMGELFFHMAEIIGEALQERNYPPLPLLETSFQKNPRQALDHYLELVVQQLDGSRLVLLIDEFEVFNQLMYDKVLDTKFLHYLRSLMQHRLGINYLLAGAPHVWRDNNANRSAFFNIAKHHALRRLERNDATDLFVNPVKGYLTYDPVMLDRLLGLTGGQPLLIHLMSEEIIQHCNRHNQRYANANDVNVLVNKVLELGHLYFTMLWSIPKSPLQRLLLALLGRDQKSDENRGQLFSLADLQEEFQRLEIAFDNNEVRRALQYLVDEEVIDIDAKGHFYSIQVGLLRAWLQRERLLDHVIANEPLLLERVDMERAD